MMNSALCALLLLVNCVVATSKRGLIGVTTSTSSVDITTFTKSSAMSWAYNYQPAPATSSYFGKLSFVPQLWGAQGASTFLGSISTGSSSKYVLAFNEPDGTGNGQANMAPAVAAQLWMQDIQPLKAQGYTLGSPAMTGAQSGHDWMAQFMGNCTACTVDFLTLHWYGNFEGLASYVGQYYATYNKTIWLTELALTDASEQDTLQMMNSTLTWLDNLAWVDRYAWFGAFRANQSNVGPNAAFMDNNGNINTLGQMYLQLSSSTSTSSSSSSSSSTTSQISAGSRLELLSFTSIFCGMGIYLLL